MKTNYIFTILVLIMMLSVSVSLYAQVQKENLVGWWHFEDETEETGNWSDLMLEGATLEGGQLVLGNGMWAHTVEYSGPDIIELTLAAWVTLDNLDEKNGSALTLDGNNRDQFCGIVYGERTARQWMSGSSNFLRTHDFPQVVTESKTGEKLLLAITYKDTGNKYEVTGYRNGKSMGSYKANHQGNPMVLQTWTEDTSEAIMGTRHTTGGNNKVTRNFIAAHLEEARIYNVALTEADIQKMYSGDLPVEPLGKLATRWGKIKSR